MEVLQVLKFSYKSDLLDFRDKWAATEAELETRMINMSSATLQGLLDNGEMGTLLEIISKVCGESN